MARGEASYLPHHPHDEFAECMGGIERHTRHGRTLAGGDGGIYQGHVGSMWDNAQWFATDDRQGRIPLAYG